MNTMKFIKSNYCNNSESSPTSNRIPLALQAVFLESNQGTEIHVPPCNNVANKIFVPDTKIDTKTNAKKWDRYNVSKKFKELAVRKALQLGRYATRSGWKSSSKRNTSRGKTQSSDKSTTSETTTARKKRQTRKRNRKSKKLKIPLPSLSPQDYLIGLLRSRGYCTKQCKSIEIGYNAKPTPLQKASYGSYMIEIVKKDTDETRLVQLLKSGLSSNPCNVFGESIVHMVCRLGKASMLQSLLEYGCDIHVADVNGRTPLHEACWSHKPQFQLVDTLLQIDPQLLLVSDVRNTLPLSFAPRQCWTEWLQYLESKKDIYWPKQNQYLDRKIQEPKWNASTLAPQLLKPDNRLVRQKKVPVLPLKIVSLVATGKINPREALILSLDLDDLSNADDSDEWFCNNTNGIDDNDNDEDNEDSVCNGNDSKNEIDSYLLDSSESDDDDDDDNDDDKDASSTSNSSDRSTDNKLISSDPTAAIQLSTDETEFLLDENEMADLLYCFTNLTKGIKCTKGGGFIWVSGGDRCQKGTKTIVSTYSDSNSSCSDDSCTATSNCSGTTTSYQRDDGSDVSTATTTTTSSEQDLIDCTSILQCNNVATITTNSLDNILETMVDAFLGPGSNDVIGLHEFDNDSEIVKKHNNITRFSDLDPEKISLMYFC